MSNQQTALLLPAPGAPFEIGKRDTPTPGPNQVLVRNKAVALNYVDNLIQKTGFIITGGFPAVLGGDGAGEIVALGSGVQAWKVGDRVFYQGAFESDRDTFQELAIADAARIAKVPSGLSYEEIVSVPLALATAAIGAYQAKSSTLYPSGQDTGGAGLVAPWEAGGRGKYAGQVAVILGGSSSVGRFAIQLAKLSSFSTIITTASKHNEAACKDIGATHVIDYREVPYTKLPEAVRNIVGDAPIKYVYNAVSNTESNNAGWELLSSGGSMIIVLPPSPESAIGTPGKDDENGRRLVFVHGAINEPCNYEFGAGLYAVLTEMFEKGELKPNKVEVIGKGLEAIPSGLEKLAKGVSGAKLVATL
ncbi:medium-chain dehydrogenase/reductase like protein [Peniophora sp. CONT]|nr:medium-chain dehydrogenase/reductase like protein [Peniophora sp. CONT]